MGATLSTHVLDTARGVPAGGIPIELYAISARGERTLRATAVTDVDGRTGTIAAGLGAGVYELVFGVENYFAEQDVVAFFTTIPVRFHVPETAGRYHVPLLLSPWGYSTYRGS